MTAGKNIHLRTFISWSSSREEDTFPLNKFIPIHVGANRYTARYWDEGTGKAVLLLPGLQGYIEEWLPVMESLSAKYRVIAVDPLGCGLSDKPGDGDYSLNGLADYLKAFLDAMRISRASLVGHSYGAAQVLRLILRYPGVLDKLVLVTPGGLAQSLGLVLRLMTLPVVGEIVSRPSKLSSKVTMDIQIHDKKLVTDELINLDFFMTSQPGEQSASLKTLRAGCDLNGQRDDTWKPHIAYLKNLGKSFLVILGKNDRLIPVTSIIKSMKDIPNARVEVINNCSHTPMLEHTNAFTGLIIDFLRHDT